MRRGHAVAQLRERGERLDHGDDHVHVTRKTAGHHGVNGDLLDGRFAQARDHLAYNAVRRQIGAGEHFVDCRASRWQDRQAVSPAAVVEEALHLVEVAREN